MKGTSKQIINVLTMFKDMGFEVVKSNYGQIALNNLTNTMPCVLTNDIEYLTPLPYKFETIDDEIKRLKEENL